MQKVKVLHFTTHDEECGIAKYQEQFINAMDHLPGVENTVFEYSPNQTKSMTPDEFTAVLQQFSNQIKDFDILHVQHEFSFYSGRELDAVVSEAKRQNKKVIITVHTTLDAGFPTFDMQDLRHIRTLLSKKRLSRQLREAHVIPLKKVDLVLTHNTVVEKSLIKRGINKKRILKITMPVPVIPFTKTTKHIANNLHKKSGDIIFATVGFLSETKGMKQAVQALSLLPDNYKLAIIGGSHPSGANDAFIKDLKQYIVDHKLSSRVYITGYIKDDLELNAFVRECDICVYPYDKKYYAGVTSAALNNALANFKPAIAYPTESIKEMNEVMEVVLLCDDFDYHDLVKKIINIDLKKQEKMSEKYARTFSYNGEAKKLIQLYTSVI